MKLIFCKSTENRIRKFQIYTCIMQAEDKKKIVIKKAVYDEGKEHIEKIYSNFKLLNTIHKDCVVTCYKVDEGIAFPYIEGVAFTQEIKEKLLQDERIEHWKKVLDEWKQLLIGNPDNITKFDNSVEFRNIFGDAEQLSGDMALKITNFDCIGENIIVAKERLYFIDYEWVFDFTIPIDFCFYRILKQFCTNCNVKFSMEKLLEAANITDENRIKKYEQLLDNFTSYVSYDVKSNVQFANLGKNFKQPRLSSQNENYKEKFLFPKVKIAEGSRLILYGAGDVGMSFYHHLIKSKEYQLVRWVDKRYKQYREDGYEVSSVQAIVEQDYDYVLIAIYNENIAKEIMNELKISGVKSEKVIWIKPQYA